MIISTNCTGCAMCSEICKVGAIQMVQNAEGFLHPVIDDTKCVECGLCQKKCPQNLKENSGLKNSKVVYAAISNDEKSLMQSSSGGAFFVLAKKVVEEGGIVCGCILDSAQKATHVFAENLQDLERMRGSKYVQSDTSNVYNHLKELLEMGRRVLFSGTPCQVAGVYQFLGRDYENLLTIDLICHGVSSPKALKQYVTYEEKKRKTQIQGLRFRSKAKEKSPYMLEIVTEKSDKIYLPQVESWYYYYFLKGTMHRECCYSCKYAREERIADITLGDFWGAENYYPIDTSKGISAVLLNTTKGVELFESVKTKFLCIESNIELAKKQNKQLTSPSEDSPEREYMIGLVRADSVEEIEKKFKKDVRVIRIKYYIKCLLNMRKRRK